MTPFFKEKSWLLQCVNVGSSENWELYSIHRFPWRSAPQRKVQNCNLFHQKSFGNAELILNKSGSFLHCVNLVGLLVIRCHQLLIAGNLPNGMRGRSQITSALPCAFQSLQSGGLSGWRKQSPFFKDALYQKFTNIEGFVCLKGIHRNSGMIDCWKLIY